ncbi:hypothetical protein [Aquipseudomonas alcaligenes]|uniref:hypothetical protein n=1 Tax=Aquipseudomonas alcaligenes TaxID=43263 RepID=UPI0035B0A775
MRKLFLLCLLCLSSLVHAAPGVFPDSTFNNLDYGLYWFGQGDTWQKAVPGQSNASGAYSSGPGQSASDLLFNSCKDNMAGYSGSNIRILGHSLGNQMAIVLTKKISDAVTAGTLSSKLLPKRVALLDPFYSNNAKSWLGNQWTGAVCRNYVS